MEYLFHPVSPCVLMNSQSFVQKLPDCMELLPLPGNLTFNIKMANLQIHSLPYKKMYVC
jgi:hypothetical protein